MNEIEKLTEYFKEFPGIGSRQAKRFVYFLLRKSPSFGNEIARLIPEIRNGIAICNECFRYFPKNNQLNICKTCSDKGRDSKQLLIVSRDVDFEAIEKSDSYHGYYFILGGTIPVLEKNPQKFIKINELKGIIEKRKENGLEEIILALNANPEGDMTADFLKKELTNTGMKISILGRGLSTGTELEYSDKDTILSALENRK